MHTTGKFSYTWQLACTQHRLCWLRPPLTELYFRPNLIPDVQFCKYLLGRGADPLRVDIRGERPRLEGLGLVAETFNPTEKLVYLDDDEDVTWIID